MALIKLPLPESVLQAAQKRIEWVMDNFSRICVSFSGGKDSTLMLHLTALHARRTGRKISVLFIDWEAQFPAPLPIVKRCGKHIRMSSNNFSGLLCR
ncbi:Co-activator of prophage gene expression IbrA [Raoultella ornithinolytica]|nr:Co-activator of prophage gene expression IbrA [Raoultella ornithinolytica]